VEKRSRVIRKIARIQHLKSGMVLSVEWSNSGRKACLLCILGRVKPQTQVVSLNWRRWRVCICIREWGLVARGRRGSGSGRHDKGLVVKPPDKPAETDAESVSLNVTLIPG
jgi:hypothetical protein